MVIFPSAERPLNSLSASSLLSVLIETEKLFPKVTSPLNDVLSLPIKMVSLLVGRLTCIILFPSSSLGGGQFSSAGISLNLPMYVNSPPKTDL